MVPMNIQINTDFPDPIETALIEQICKACSKKVAHISPFKRFGKSGAHLLLTFFNDKPMGPPYLIKICKNTKSKPYADRECKAVEHLFGKIADCKLVHNVVFKADGWGALLYEHRGSVTADYAARFPLSFRDIMYQHGKLKDCKERAKIPSINLTIIENTLRNALSSLKDAHSDSKPQERNLRKIY